MIVKNIPFILITENLFVDQKGKKMTDKEEHSNRFEITTDYHVLTRCTNILENVSHNQLAPMLTLNGLQERTVRDQLTL